MIIIFPPYDKNTLGRAMQIRKNVELTDQIFTLISILFEKVIIMVSNVQLLGIVCIRMHT